MEFGVTLNPQAPNDESVQSLVDGLVEQTRTARAAGFDLIKMGQHYLSDQVQLQVLPMLGHLSAHSGSMTTATGIVLLPLHHPVEIAEQISTLDAVSERTIAGVGAGYRDIEFESFGVDKSERVPRLKEGIELMNRLWTEPEVTYRGQHYSVERVGITPRPATKPPVWVGASADRAVERAARIGDAWLVSHRPPISKLERQKKMYDDVRNASGEDTAIPIQREAFVAPTTEEAVETTRGYLEEKYRKYLEWGQNGSVADELDLDRSFHELASDRFLLGTPAEVCAEIERYDELLDLSHVIVRVHWPGMSYDRACECLELFGDEVIPNL